MTQDLRDDQTEQDRSSRIAGRYKVERLIARGGMATVYLATHVDLNRPVALKVLRPPDDAENASDFAERFRLEAMTLATLDHPHIVTLHDFGELPDERWFLAMEFIDGPRLSDLMRQGPMDPSRAINLLLQVCRALRYAHGRGVIHRDLKPSNLMIQRLDDGSEHVKVVDFGLVKLTDADQTLTRAGLILGSPHCMSPEQVKGAEVDATADVYAVGVLLFRAVTGKYPFHGPNSAATMMAHLHAEVPSFYSIDPDMQVPEGLEEVVRTCLAKESAARFPTMDALIAALGRLVDAPPELYPTSATSSPTLPMVPVTRPLDPGLAQERERDRRFFLAGTLGAVVLGALGLGAGWAIVYAMRSPPAPSPVAAVATPVEAPAPPAVEDPAPAPPAAATPVEAAPEAQPTPPPAAAPTASEVPRARPTPAPRATPAAPRPAERPANPPPPTPTPASPEAPNPDGYKGLPEDW